MSELIKISRYNIGHYNESFNFIILFFLNLFISREPSVKRKLIKNNNNKKIIVQRMKLLKYL